MQGTSTNIFEELTEGHYQNGKALGKKKFTELLTDAGLVIKPPGNPGAESTGGPR